MKEVNWNEAPEWATHALTTGPKWDSDPECVGTIEWAFINDENMYSWQGADRGEHFVMGVERWVVLEDRPIDSVAVFPEIKDFSEDGGALSDQVGGDHYSKLAIQPVEYIHKNGLGYLEGSAIKYLTRHKDKNGLQDLEKAKHFIDLLIEMEYSDA